MMYQDFKMMPHTELCDWQQKTQTFLSAFSPAEIKTWQSFPEDAMSQGLALLSAYTNVHSFISNFRAFPAARAAALLVTYLKEALRKSGITPPRSDVRTNAPASFSATKVSAPFPPASVGDTPSSIINDAQHRRHLDQYLHILPPELVAMSQDLEDRYLELADIRIEAEYLVADDKQSDMSEEESLSKQKQLAQLSDDIISSDLSIAHFWAMVDLAIDFYNKQGRVATMAELDVLPTEKKKPVVRNTEGLPYKRPADYTKEEVDAIIDPAQQEEIKKARIKSDRAYLRRTDISKTDEWYSQVIIRAKELLAWNEKLTKKNIEVLALAGHTPESLSF